MEKVEDIVIVGGGIAGLTTSLGRDGAIFWAMAPPPPPKKKFGKKRRVYILLTDLSNFAHIKLDLPPSTKSLTPLNKMKKPKKHLHI